MSKIEWLASYATEPETWNVIAGCSPASTGCAHCYAARMAARLESMGIEHYAGVTTGGAYNGVVQLAPDMAFNKPLAWRAPRTCFVCSMSDIMHDRVQRTTIERVLRIAEQAKDKSGSRFIFLTKRPERLARFDWSRFNLGITAENQVTFNERLRDLGEVKAGFKFISAEPLLGPLDIRGVNEAGVQLIIVGGETGPGARPMNLEWARSIREQCLELGIDFFFKRTGGVRGGEDTLDDVAYRRAPRWI